MFWIWIFENYNLFRVSIFEFRIFNKVYYDIQALFDGIAITLGDFYNSPFVLVWKILAAVYIVVLSVNIVLMLIFRDVPSQIRVGIKGADLPLASKNKLQKRWEQVKSRIKSGSPSQYKVAIIEADAIAEEILDNIGYKGANMAERLQQVGVGHLDDHLEALLGVHEIRNRIIHEADFEIDENMAEAVIGVYENFLRYLEFLS